MWRKIEITLREYRKIKENNNSVTLLKVESNTEKTKFYYIAL